MQKKFLGNLFFIILLNLLIKPFYIFGIDIQVQNLVGAEDYGMYFSLLNFSFLFNMFLDVGITNYNTKNTAQHPYSITKYIGSFFGLKLSLALLYIFITLGFALVVGYNDKEMYLLSFFVVNQIFIGIIQYLRSNFAGLHLFKIDATLSVLDRFLLIIMTSILIYGNVTSTPFQIEWFVYLQTLTYGLTMLTALVLTRIKIGKIKIRFRKIFSFAILKQSTPFALLILLMTLYTRIDSVMIERMLPDGKEQAGIYAQGFRLLDAVNMFAFLVAGLLLPIFARLIGEKEPVRPVLQMAAKILVGIAIVVGVGIALNSYTVISFIYHDQVELSSEVFFWLILSFIPLSFSHVFGTLLTANHSLKLLNQMALVGIAVNIGLNYLMIPKMGAEGAAISTLITQSLTALLQVLLVLKVFQFSFHWGSIWRFCILLLAYLGVVYSFKEYFGNLMGVLLTLVVGVVLLLLLKLLNIRDILGLLQSKVKEN